MLFTQNFFILFIVVLFVICFLKIASLEEELERQQNILKYYVTLEDFWELLNNVVFKKGWKERI